MKSNALYFPSIDLPQDAWSARALLYWDGLATIIPMAHLEGPEEVSYFMQGLLSEGLVRPVIPAQHLYECRSFSENFISYLDEKLRLGTLPGRDAPNLGFKRIHAEKLEDVPQFLSRQRLAYEITNGWYDVREDVADQFMFYLAACLGAMERVDAIPVTDGKAFSKRPFTPPSSSRSRHVDKARQVVLNNILPAPAGGVTVDQLLFFKEKHGHLLPRFRQSVEEHCVLIAGILDAELRLESTNNFIMRCKQEVKQIEDAMRPTFGSIMFTSLLPLLGSGIGFDVNGGARNYAAGAITLATAIYDTVSLVREHRDIEVNHPLAYVARASGFNFNSFYVPE
ncbi:hypothetical protein HUW52_14005 [Pseudomonas sp. 43A]|nr:MULTISPECIES: hypothetical protein [unclassified Pseudomonas]QKV63951.1 hypothetical protein HUW52_14005 [Pseudomonas sp. 43A]QMW07908.1 hypothetical protein H3303_18690 [Pseudomonas sp. 29A]